MDHVIHIVDRGCLDKVCDLLVPAVVSHVNIGHLEITDNVLVFIGLSFAHTLEFGPCRILCSVECLERKRPFVLISLIVQMPDRCHQFKPLFGRDRLIVHFRVLALEEFGYGPSVISECCRVDLEFFLLA